MTDRGEGELRKWALKRNGDPISNRDIVELVFAMADDDEKRHDELLTIVRGHLEEAKVRDKRIGVLELWHKDTIENCEDRIRRLWREEHAPLHDDHLQRHHAIEDERADWLIRTLGEKGAGLLLFVTGGLMMAVLSYLLWGTP